MAEIMEQFNNDRKVSSEELTQLIFRKMALERQEQINASKTLEIDILLNMFAKQFLIADISLEILKELQSLNISRLPPE